MWRRHAILVPFAFALVRAQTSNVPPDTRPTNYTGIPAGDYSTDWQAYFQVDASKLPNISFALPRSFAGNIATATPGHPDNSLFFWTFEHSAGSLTDSARASDPWIIWLNGGPGSSSFLGFFFENGPIHVDGAGNVYENVYSWNRLADTIWIDQPVGTGWSTSDRLGYITDEDRMGQDFVGFLANLVKVFPSLATRPLYLTGESYAGMYIPYITKTILASTSPPVNLAKIAIGDGAIGNIPATEDVPMLSVIETYPQIIDFDPQVYEFFKAQTDACGYTVNLTHPQLGPLPTFETIPPTSYARQVELAQRSGRRRTRSLRAQMSARRSQPISRRGMEVGKRDLGPPGVIDPWYGCYLLDQVIDYSFNFTFPWTQGGWDIYDIPDALYPEVPQNAETFMNDNATRAALHGPQKDWSDAFNYPFGSTYGRSSATDNPFGDPSIPAVNLLSDIAEHGIPMVFYSGNADALVPHRGTEITIQNFTFGGIQGFTRKPATPWHGDDGEFAGLVHSERGVTYVLFVGAGHLVPQFQPARALTFLREFVLGSNTTGLVRGDGKVQGGEDESALEIDYIPAADDAIYYGRGTTQGSVVWPDATRAAWKSFMSEPTAPVGSAPLLGTGAGVARAQILGWEKWIVVSTYLVWIDVFGLL